MGRRKKGSRTIETALKRAAGLSSISANLDLGQGLTLEAFQGAIRDAQARLDAYNEALSAADAAANAFAAAEAKLRDLSSRMLNAVAAVYGKDSDEYEKAGGVRKSERKRPKRKPQA